MAVKRTQEELKDIIQWDVKNWGKCLNFWEENMAFSSSQKILALGEREGGMSLHFALNGHDVICSDYNPMPEATKQMHDRYNVSDKITYVKIDMKAIDLEDASVDIVVFKSVLGALGNERDQAEAIHEIYRVLKPGGYLIFAENLIGSGLHQFLRKKFVSWGARWRYITRKEMITWGHQFKKHHTVSKGMLALFGRSEGQRNLLSGFDRILTPITPKRWRYILFGVFEK